MSEQAGLLRGPRRRRATPRDQQIKSAYRKLALKYHPGSQPGRPDAEEAFKEAAEAYAVLCDREKRALYDRFGHAGVSGAGAGPAGSIRTIFAGLLGHLRRPRRLLRFRRHVRRRRRRGGPQRGADLRYDLEISFEESSTGTETSIQIPREETCETCKGSGAAAGTLARNVPQCSGSGQLRYPAGLPDGRAPLRQLPRHRQDRSRNPARPAAAPAASGASARSR